ncbi:MAG TPA: sugar phosphate isomerase/epimerase family protein [Chthoniobacteraceae bacterium]|jgi:sugar phosphate isomerase/epimerase|nr:sugar phosphate isomerase/epimerase family protein [Chthoniobacteraceae bacterium]
MTNWPIGLSTGCFHRSHILDCLGTIRASGFHLLEICSLRSHLDYHQPPSLRATAARLEELGMEAHSFHAPFADRIDLASLDAHRRESSFEEIIRAAEAAAALKARWFVLHPGPEHAQIRHDETRLRHLESLAGVVQRIARRCAELGLHCVLENKLPHLLFGNTGDLRWILDALASSDVGVCLDTGHALLTGDFRDMVGKLAPHVRIIHAHDNRNHHDDHLAPGDGLVDWPWLFGTLRAAGFQGAFMLEMASAPDPATMMENARRGREFLQKAAGDSSA